MEISLEIILSRLLIPDNAVLVQATQELKEAFKDPDIILALCNVLKNSQNVQVRQFAAVLLRKNMTKYKQWSKFSSDVKQGLKQTLLQILSKETEKVVRIAIAQLISTVAKHELDTNEWPELLQVINEYINSTSVTERELGLHTLSTIVSSAGESMKPHFKSLLSVFARSLQDNSSKLIPFYTIQCMTNIVSYIGSDEMNQFQHLIPYVMAVIRSLAVTDEDEACEAMEIFDELVECEVTVIVPHIKSLIEMCLEIAANQNLGNSIRVKALSIISWLTRLKKKTILKFKLVSPILDVTFPIMCQSDDKENEDDCENDASNSGHSPSSFAAQVIDVMALHLPPEKLVSPLLRHLEPALNSDIPNHKKAAYLALGVIAEGCSENIRTKHLKSILQVICKGITDTRPLVRNAALFALGQYAEFLQPDINKFVPDLMPVLLQYLSETCQQLQQGEKDPPSLTKTFYALETFCENLGDDLLPYLPSLMEQLLTFLSSTSSFRARELAISAIGAVAGAAKEGLLPYFPHIIDNLKCYLNKQPQQTQAQLTLQIQAIDTVAALGRTIGPGNFFPMAHDCMRLGLELVDEVHDPDLRRCTYGLFASVSTILKADMAQYLPTVMDHMITSLQSTEGIVVHPNEEENGTFTLFEGIAEDLDPDVDISQDSIADNDEKDSAKEAAGYSVENAYLDEKEDTCCALNEIAANVGVAFLPYLMKSFEEVQKLVDHPAVEVRKAAISCLGQFCISLYSSIKDSGISEHKSLETIITTLMPKLIAAAREDTEYQGCLACLETINDILKEIKEISLIGNYADSIVALIKDAFKQKLSCQDDEDNDEEEADTQEAEYDALLMEYAGEIMPSLANILPDHEFSAYFAGIMPLLLAKTKRNCTVSDKSFSIGTLAEIVHCLQPRGSRPFVPHLLPVFLNGTKDEDEEVRSNSVYGLGVLVENAGETVYSQYPMVLQVLSNMLSHEDNRRAKDNICATVARLITTNSSLVPLNQVFPAFLGCLPLEEDFEENDTVFKCIYQLYNSRCEEVFRKIPEILKIAAAVINSENISSGSRNLLVQIIKGLYQEFPADFETVLASLSPDSVASLKSAVMSS